MTNIRAIAEAINKIAPQYELGNLQSLRKQLKGKRSRRSKIFDLTKNSVNEDEGWAFHTGGREELQFNIGLEREQGRFRFGVAFSLEPSRSMPNIAPLFPKIEAFNEFVRVNPEELANCRMWVWRGNRIVIPDTEVRPIADGEVKKGNFIFAVEPFQSIPSISLRSLPP